MMSTATPIACTLRPGYYRERLAVIAELNGSALRSYRLRGPELELTYARDAAARVRELVRLERQCCAFLRFDIHEDGDALRLTIGAPEAVRADAATLLAPFLPLTASDAEKACSGESCGCGERRHAGESNSASFDVGTATRSDRDTRAASVATTSAAIGALACGVCCVLPLAVPAVTLTGLGAVVAFLGRSYWWAIGLASTAASLGWIWLGVQVVRTRRRPGRSTLQAMTFATALVVVAIGWSYVEPTIRTLVRR